MRAMLSAKLGPYEENKMSTSFWLAVAAYVLPTFPLGYFWHLKTFKPNYDALSIYRDDVIIPLGLSSMIIQGLFFAWVYPKLFSTAPDQWLTSAAQFAGIFGILAWSFLVLPVAAKNKMTSVQKFMALETAFTAIQFIVAGLLIALAYRGT
jgi:hypothetical protein